jgi:hypothetical protein
VKLKIYLHTEERLTPSPASLRRTVYQTQEQIRVLTATSMKMTVFWVVAPCSLVEVYRRFRGPCCLHHQGATSQKTIIFIEVDDATSKY